MDIIIGLALFVVGALLYRFVWLRISNAGTLLVDRSNPEKDIFRFDIDNFDNLNKKHWVVLKVSDGHKLSRK